MPNVLAKNCGAVVRHASHWCGTDKPRCVGTDLVTDACTGPLHVQYGGACLWCCDWCNYAYHRCHGCGTSVRHDYTEWTEQRAFHACYLEPDELRD